jgi:hypothetical protein
MNILKATEGFEKWLAAHIRIVKPDLAFKHRAMTASPFMFFRATFYRWVQTWEEVSGDAAAAPSVLAVGDLHVENFGTWRDCEGRLIWGVNDFDEVFPLPYTIDLVRLTASAHLATQVEHLQIRPRKASDAILQGYRDALDAGGRPFVLGEYHRWLRKIAFSRLRDPIHFWQKMDSFPAFRGSVPRKVLRALKGLLPDPRLPFRKKKRIAGLGSLGHERLVIVAEWRGGRVAREAKALVPSACFWVTHRRTPERIRYDDIIRRAIRVPDPYLRPLDNWLLRRLAPDCSRIELVTLPQSRDEERLLYSMGWETANVHLGSGQAIPALKRDLKKRRAGWLHQAAKEMVRTVRRDWERWKRG